MKKQRLGTPKLFWADQAKFEFWGHFKGQKAIFGKDTGHKGLKFCTVPYVYSIYNFVSMSFSVSCIDQKIQK